MTGTWTTVGPIPTGGSQRVPISFPIPLAADIEGANVHVVGESGTPPAECPGTADAPAADPGHLCIYAGNDPNGFADGSDYLCVLTGGALPCAQKPTTGGEGVDTAGATVAIASTQDGGGAYGTWAVQAP